METLFIGISAAVFGILYFIICRIDNVHSLITAVTAGPNAEPPAP
jgi:hypothetical protein